MTRRNTTPRAVTSGRQKATTPARCPNHGLYQAGCANCQKASAKYANITRAERERGITRRIDATGTRRRIQALAVMGYDNGAIARTFLHLFGRHLHLSNVQQWSKRQTVLRTNADQLKAVYEHLCMTPGPSKKARELAHAQDWVGPLAWDDDTIDDPKARPIRHARKYTGQIVDEMAVLRATDGDRVNLTPTERGEAVRILHARGLSDAAIGRLLHVTSDTVLRARKRLGLPANFDTRPKPDADEPDADEPDEDAAA